MNQHRYRATWYAHDERRIYIERWVVIRSTDHTEWLKSAGYYCITASDIRDNNTDNINDDNFGGFILNNKIKMVRKTTSTVQRTIKDAISSLRVRTWKSYKIRNVELDIAKNRLRALGEELPIPKWPYIPLERDKSTLIPSGHEWE
jgi:hypothetical protein